MPVKYTEGELLVGEHGGDHEMTNFRPLQPGDYVERIQASPLLSDAQKKRMVKGVKTEPFAYQLYGSVAPWTEEVRRAQEHAAIEIWGTDLNHSIRAYEKVLKLGFSGLKAQVEERLATLDHAMPDAPEQRANLLAWQRFCEVASGLGKRHAAELRLRAQLENDEGKREELEQLATICERVPEQPATTFHEALQSLWFAHMITCWEDNLNANGLGRMDQYLWPYLEADLAEGRLDWKAAAELLGAFWLKLYLPYDVQQAMVGGQLPDGTDATNPLSYLILDVTEGMGFVRCLSARLHKGSPRAFVSRCVDLLAKGGGIPFFFNDEALVPALVAQGLPVEDARGYAAIGCIEITLPGMANPHAVSHWINLAKCLEFALNDGKDMLDGVQVGPKTGTLAEFKSLEDVIAAYKQQVEYFAPLAVYGSNSAELAHRSQFRLPYLSLLTDDCVAKGKDIIQGGARYNYHSSAAMAIPNVADSLAALQKAVFEEKKVTGAELLEALRTNYEGQEELLLYLRHKLPKYGNDEALPDGFAAEITRHYCDELGKHRTVSGGRFHCHLFTFTLMLHHGKRTAASAEGRKFGEPLAYSLSPVQGRDHEGFTAVIQSLAKLPHDKAAASSSAILEADPVLLRPENRPAFVDLIQTAIALGVGQMQLNVVSEDLLRAAQERPEEHRNLCVRVSGFSQLFCLLDRELQNHIIARTKHER